MADKPEERESGKLVTTDDDLTISVPENLSIVVDLPPAPAPEAPDDEVAVAIDDIPVNPGFVASPTESTTMSVTIVASRLATGPTATHDQGERHDVAPLPGTDAFSQSRRDRLRGEQS